MGVRPGRMVLGREAVLAEQRGGSTLLCELLNKAAVFWELFIHSPCCLLLGCFCLWEIESETRVLLLPVTVSLLWPSWGKR